MMQVSLLTMLNAIGRVRFSLKIQRAGFTPRATPRHEDISIFLTPVLARLKLMVGWIGESQDSPTVAGSVNPIQFTTQNCVVIL